jgi:hypothetical protein
MISSKMVVVSLVISLAIGRELAAQNPEIPNWTVPPYRGASALGGLTTMTDTSPGVAFVAMQPCRVFDTRNANGPYGGPRLLANTTRNFDVDNGPCTGIPTGVDAYSMNFGAILPDGLNSFVTIWPTGSAQPVVSSINPIQGGVVANAAIVPAGTGGSISVFPNTGMHLYGDINGYFTDQFNPNVSVHAVSSTAAAAVLGENTSTAALAYAVEGVVTSTAPGSGSAAIRGINNSTGGLTTGYGVWGSHAGGGRGVYGTSVNGSGVWGEGGTGGSVTPNFGVHGFTFSAVNPSAGVLGETVAASGVIYGVWGNSGSATNDTAGVRGTTSMLPNVMGSFLKSGSRGESKDGFGVVGISETSAVAGALMNPATGGVSAMGSLGTVFGTDPDGGGPPWAVFGQGNIGATGIKPFIEPHPTDPSRVIQYIALEGAEAGTYFRGRGTAQNGIAKIAVPEDFRLVSDEEGLSVQITPIGEMATFAVLAVDLHEIVVRASRNVDFYYLVHGERRTFRREIPIRRGDEFRPESGDSRIPSWLSAEQKRLLVANGTYNPDGTVNMETARRLGWDKEWERRSRPGPQPSD